METKLESFLSKIDPSRTYDDVSVRVDRGFNSFVMPREAITSYEEYENVIADFYGHIQSVVLRLDTGSPKDRQFHWPLCLTLIEKAFGPTGYHTTYTITETGKEGGIYNILKQIANLMAEQYTQNQINYEIHTYWNSLTVNEKLTATNEYIGKYGHLLPGDMTMGNAPRIKAFFVKVLEEHPKLIRKMRKIGR